MSSSEWKPTAPWAKKLAIEIVDYCDDRVKENKPIEWGPIAYVLQNGTHDANNVHEKP